MVHDLQQEVREAVNTNRRNLRDIERVLEQRERRLNLGNSDLIHPGKRQQVFHAINRYDQRQKKADELARAALRLEGQVAELWDQVRVIKDEQSYHLLSLMDTGFLEALRAEEQIDHVVQQVVALGEEEGFRGESVENPIEVE